MENVKKHTMGVLFGDWPQIIRRYVEMQKLYYVGGHLEKKMAAIFDLGVAQFSKSKRDLQRWFVPNVQLVSLFEQFSQNIAAN